MNFHQRASHQGLMTQSAFISPVYVSNRRLENINCIYEPTDKIGGLFLGDIVSTLKVELLKQHRITVVLSCLVDRVSLPVMMSAHKILPLQDTLEFPILHFFDEAVEWIDSKRKDGHNVLVHCHAGVSRSATIVVAYLMRFKGWTAFEALSYVRLRRERAKPNASFWNQLLEYQSRIIAQGSSEPKQGKLENQPQIKSVESKENLNHRVRHSQRLPETETYQIKVHTAKRQTQSTPLKSENHSREEPKSQPHPKRKRIFDQQFSPQQKNEVRKHEFVSTEPLVHHATEMKKFSNSIIFPNQRDMMMNTHHLEEDPFRETKSSIEYRGNTSQQYFPMQSSTYYSPIHPRQQFVQREMSYVSPFELGGYIRPS